MASITVPGINGCGNFHLHTRRPCTVLVPQRQSEGAFLCGEVEYAVDAIATQIIPRTWSSPFYQRPITREFPTPDSS